MKSRSEVIQGPELFGTINRNVEELSYVQVNIYGTKLNDLRRRGVDVLKILKGLGVDECLMLEVPLPPLYDRQTVKLGGSSGNLAPSTRKSPGRVRPSLSTESSSFDRSNFTIKEEIGKEEAYTSKNDREVGGLSQDFARDGCEDMLQESEPLLNCSISTIHSSRTKDLGEGPVRLARRSTVNSDCTGDVYPPLVVISRTTNEVNEKDDNGVIAEKVQDDVEMNAALDDDTHLFDPNIDYLATPPLVDDVINVGGANSDIMRRESGGAQNFGQAAAMAISTDSAALDPCRSLVKESSTDDVTEKERNGAHQGIVPIGEQISSKEVSAIPASSENTLESVERRNQSVGENPPAEPAKEAVGSNSHDGLDAEEDEEFFDCSIGSFSDVEDVSAVQSTSANLIRPIPVWPRETCSLLSGLGNGPHGMMKKVERRRMISLQETQRCSNVIGLSSLPVDVSKWNSPIVISSEFPQSTADLQSETVVTSLNPQNEGSVNDVESNEPAYVVDSNQTPPIQTASSTLKQSNLQKVGESEENGRGFFYGGLYFDASFRSVVSHPSLIMEMEKTPNKEPVGAQHFDEVAPVNGNSCGKTATGEEMDHSINQDHFIDQPMEPLTGISSTASMEETSQPSGSHRPAASTSDGLLIDHPRLSIDEKDLSIVHSRLSINSRELSIDRPRPSTPPPDVLIDKKDLSIDRGEDQMVAVPLHVSATLDHEDCKTGLEQGTSSSSTVKVEERGRVTRNGNRIRTLRKRKNSQVSCDSSNSKSCTPRGTVAKGVEEFQCMYPGCRSKIQWRSRYGKDRLLNHVRLHSPKQSKKCPRCDFTAAVGRTVRRHFEQEHVNERWSGHVNLESLDDVAELVQLWSTCFPSASRGNNSDSRGNDSPPEEWPREMTRISELYTPRNRLQTTSEQV